MRNQFPLGVRFHAPFVLGRASSGALAGVRPWNRLAVGPLLCLGLAPLPVAAPPSVVGLVGAGLVLRYFPLESAVVVGLVAPHSVAARLTVAVAVGLVGAGLAQIVGMASAVAVGLVVDAGVGPHSVAAWLGVAVPVGLVGVGLVLSVAMASAIVVGLVVDAGVAPHSVAAW